MDDDKVTVKCTLPNASGLINGIAFAPGTDGVMTATDVSSEDAIGFAEIPGFQLIVAGTKPIEAMTVAEITTLLADHPSAWQEVAAAESARAVPRAGVVKLVEQAHSAEMEAQNG